MSKKQDIIIKTEDEEILIPKYKQKSILDHGMILLGVLMALIFFVVIFDLFYEPSLFGLLFNKEEWQLYKESFTLPVGYNESGNAIKFYDDGLQLMGFWAPTIIYTILFIGSVVLMIILVTNYIRDYVEVIRGLIKGAIALRKGVSDSVKDAFSDFEKKEITIKKSDIVSGADSEILSNKKKIGEASNEKETTKKKVGRPSKKKENENTNVTTTIDLAEEELDKMLTDPSANLRENFEAPKTIEKPEYTPKSLFSDRD